VSQSPAAHQATADQRDPRRWWALTALSLAVLLVTVDNTILAVAIPSLTVDLAPTTAELLWIGDMYGFVLAGLLITMGSLGDKVGRKRLLMIGLVSFALVSILAASAPSAIALIGARGLLGVAGATLMPSTLSLIRNTFLDTKERTFAIGVWSAVAAAGGGVGPILGGALLEHYWWGAVFLVNVPIVAVIIVIGALSLRESKQAKPGPIDLISAGLLLFGMISSIYGIKEITIVGLEHTGPWIALVLGIAAVFAFIRRQLKLESPMLDVRLFKVPAFSGAVGADLISVFGLMGVYFFLAQQFQLADGDSPLTAGLRLLPAETAALVGALVAAKVIYRSGRRTAIGGGIGLGAVGLLIVGLILGDGIVPVAMAMVLIGFGFGLSLTGTSDAILAAAPPDRAGSAAAVSETAYELGAALGIAILGSILAAWYRQIVVVPEGIPPTEAAATSDSLSSAYEAATHAPAAIADAVLEASRVAFTSALGVTCLIAAVMCAIGSFIAFRVLPPKNEEVDAVSDH